ncbi:transposase [Waddlia chondrophila WSU 86-1044]|uniref:Transposase n=1 Tax=Waddlia chondrophila (strain ATCC VR-1470 / WSU 86-1044) TaxID=716544 RepID=D6YT96_WADCW|nr:transposase [Waddlia chondrophila WSU 86-1044]
MNVRLGDDRICFLVILGALPNGKKELVAIHNGYRESKSIGEFEAARAVYSS